MAKRPLKLIASYSSYPFANQDPVIKRVGALVKNEKLKHRQISKRSGVATSTMSNWFNGKTRRPQYATIMAVVRALGYREQFVKEK